MWQRAEGCQHLQTHGRDGTSLPQGMGRSRPDCVTRVMGGSSSVEQAVVIITLFEVEEAM